MRTTLQEARHLIQKRRDLAVAENAVREAGDCERPSIASMIVLTRMEIEEADDVLAEIDHALMAMAD